MKVNQLNAPISKLGEGIYLDNKQCSLYWLDIIESTIYQYDIKRDFLIKKYYVGNNPSCILSVDNDRLVYLDNVGVKEINISNDTITLIKKHDQHCPLECRANDGVLLSNNSIIYGTMNYNPHLSAGNIYILNEGRELFTYNLGVNIPNTFIELEDSILVSDSLSKCIYKFTLQGKNEDKLTLWKSFSKEAYTPDGGCLSDKGYIHVALWDGAAVLVMNKNGEEVKKIEIPVLRPTNCVIYKNRWLYITSASEDMTNKQLELYPWSGKTLVVDLGENYEF
ncbi:SMP-30/gluconolactonase/LRE family protein [Vibrio fluvialis]|nr:hypothetical protein [Vibrio fluvialis]ELH7952390.1 SMP-30/gluconolactonase/LRE family protein [Vibrio fluvialis]MBY8121152.1 SMP-30/gluconolactonase/LRE family protein [Vibrio fluvialis]MBY8262302.1 SMP-30/gluconolactonase/LRE family protein [Vibrio fluvialis]MBY8304442.1 SMP-30/gluconolactonase/LRE family protein [Vibrio fluvialis]